MNAYSSTSEFTTSHPVCERDLHHNITKTYMCFFLLATVSSLAACQELFLHCNRICKQGGNPRRGRDRRQEKENIFGAMFCRSKTWQSHDQRHLIILELHCSFNLSQRTVFYWVGGGHVRVVNGAGKAATNWFGYSLDNVAQHIGVQGRMTV